MEILKFQDLLLSILGLICQIPLQALRQKSWFVQKNEQEFKFEKSGFIGVCKVCMSIISEIVIAENGVEKKYLHNCREYLLHLGQLFEYKMLRLPLNVASPGKVFLPIAVVQIIYNDTA